jgi:alginate O-acetyltransferase complex protein AlgJ
MFTTAFAVIALAFFATPVALRAVGVTATSFENRRFAAAPKPSQGWDFFQQTTRFLTDRLPLREQAVRANNSLWRTFFGTSPRYGAATADGALPFAGQPPPATARKDKQPTPEVIEGRHGWLFLKGELERACKPLLGFRQALARWRELVAVVRAAGKRAVMLVPPDKGSIYGEELPPGQLTDCGRSAKRRFWTVLANAPQSWGVRQLEGEVVRRKRGSKIPLYSKTDSHWNTLGSLTLVRAVLDALGRGVTLKRGEVVPQGSSAFVGDLTVLRGDRTTEKRPLHTIRRAPGAQRVSGRTLFMYDSFGDAPLPLLKLYFRHLSVLPWVGPTDAQRADAIAHADTVIFESTEREFGFRASEAGPVSRSFLGILRKRLGER